MLSAGELAREYDLILRDYDLVRLHRDLQDEGRKRGLTYKDRVVCQVLRPFFITRDHYDLLLDRARRIVDALHLVAVDVVRKPELADRLGLTATERRLIALAPSKERPDLVGRLDAFVAADGNPLFVEYNGESPGGMAFGDCLGDVFDATPPLQRLRSRHRITRPRIVGEVVEAFRRGWGAWARRHGREDAEPSVAIVDLAHVPTRSEFEHFRRAFLDHGIACQIVDEDELELDEEGLFRGDDRFNVVYRRLVTPDLLIQLDESHVLVQAAARDVCFMGNGFGAYGLCHKGLFALLQDPERRPTGLNDGHRAAIAASLPWTRLAIEGPTEGPSGGRVEPLSRIVQRERTRLVVKPALSYGGLGVHLGWRTGPDEWEQVWAEALRGRYVVQERVDVPVETYPAVVDGKAMDLPLQFDVDPYIVGGQRATGLGIRLSGGDLLNVSSGAGSAVPAYVLEPE